MSKININKINEEIVSEYEDNYKEYVDIIGNYRSCTKLSGNLFALIIKKYIDKIFKKHNLKYKVSNNNAFIKGCPVEWDLIILKDTALDRENNVFESNDVICVIELKTGGQPLKKDKDICLKNLYDKKFKQIDKIRFIYISYFDMTNSYLHIKNYFNSKNQNNNSMFTFYSGNSYPTRKYIEECNDFEKFICDIVK